MATFTYLALGDSYTIGEGVPLYDSFPYQVVQLLRKAGKSFAPPEIVARTGWTTDELADGMANTVFLPAYDLVSLLIGVNNQYRGRDREEYGRQFEELLQQAIRLAGEQESPGLGKRVFILSIPDWGVTPFARVQLPDAQGRDKAVVALEIDVFNKTAEEIAAKYGCPFLDITEHTRLSAREVGLSGEDTCQPSPFAADGLHPSGAEYRFWSERLSEKVLDQ